MLKIPETVKNAQDTMYVKCGLTFENFSPEDESSAYYAKVYLERNRKKIQEYS
jgi:hypothetical protein